MLLTLDQLDHTMHRTDFTEQPEFERFQLSAHYFYSYGLLSKTDASLLDDIVNRLDKKIAKRRAAQIQHAKYATRLSHPLPTVLDSFIEGVSHTLLASDRD